MESFRVELVMAFVEHQSCAIARGCDLFRSQAERAALFSRGRRGRGPCACF